MDEADQEIRPRTSYAGGEVLILTIHDQRNNAEVELEEMALLVPWS